MASQARCGLRRSRRVAQENGNAAAMARVVTSVEGPFRKMAAPRPRRMPATRRNASNRGGGAVFRRGNGMDWYAAMPMRTVAIPALTWGCARAPASIKPMAAASTSPPSVSAGRPVLGSEDALAFLRTMRLEGTGTVRMGGALVGGLAAVVTRSGSIRVSIAIGAFEGSIRFARGSAVGRDVVGGFTASGFAAIAGLAAGGDDS